MMRFSYIARPRAHFVLTTATFGLLCLAPLLLAPRAAHAQIASDNGGNTVYNAANGGWQNGDNGGSGYMPWILSTGGGGTANFSIENSDGNGGTPNIGATSFRLFADNNSNAQARRNFASTLGQDQFFSVLFDNGSVQDNGSANVGFELINSAGNPLFQFLRKGGNYLVTDGTGSQFNTSVGDTRNGLKTFFKISGTNQYSFEATRLDGVGSYFTGGSYNSGVKRNLLNPTGGQVVAGVRFFNNQGGGNSQVYYNNMEIFSAPEPGTVALAGLALPFLGLTLRARRRR